MINKRGVLAFLTVVMLMMSIFMPNVYASEVTVRIDGVPVQFDVQPFIYEGRTMVPVRAIAEILDVDIRWEQETRTVTYTNFGSNSHFELMIGRSYAVEMDSAGFEYEIDLDVPPMIVDGRTFVPLRFVAESLDIIVDFEDGAVLLSTENWSTIIFYSRIGAVVINLAHTVWVAEGDDGTYHLINDCGDLNSVGAIHMTRRQAQHYGKWVCQTCWLE